MLFSSRLRDSSVIVLISSLSRCWPSRVRYQKHDFLFPSLPSWLQVLRKLLLKHRLCRMVFFQPSGAVWKKGKCSLGTDTDGSMRITGVLNVPLTHPKIDHDARCCSKATLPLEITHRPLNVSAVWKSLPSSQFINDWVEASQSGACSLYHLGSSHKTVAVLCQNIKL